MKPDEIKKVLGKPKNEGEDEESGNWVMDYIMADRYQLSFYSEKENQSPLSVVIQEKEENNQSAVSQGVQNNTPKQVEQTPKQPAMLQAVITDATQRSSVETQFKGIVTSNKSCIAVVRYKLFNSQTGQSREDQTLVHVMANTENQFSFNAVKFDRAVLISVKEM